MNLKEEMPDKFDGMVELWKQATVDEVFPCYMPKEQSALAVSTQYNSGGPLHAAGHITTHVP